MVVMVIGICIVLLKPHLLLGVLRLNFYLNPSDATIKDDINIIRERAHCTQLYGGNITIGDIMNERARELFWEEFRNVEFTLCHSVWPVVVVLTNGVTPTIWRPLTNRKALI